MPFTEPSQTYSQRGDGLAFRKIRAGASRITDRRANARPPAGRLIAPLKRAKCHRMLMTRISCMGALFDLAPLLGRQCREQRISRYVRMNVGEIDLAGERNHKLKKLSPANDHEFRRSADMFERLFEAVHSDRAARMPRRIARE